MSEREQIGRLCTEANALHYGPTRTALLEEAVRLADCAGDIQLGVATRSDLMLAAVYGGRPDLLLVAFPWCLAQADRDPTLQPYFNLLWKYKWVVGNVVRFPQISRRQIESLLDDMTERYLRAGSTMHAVHQHRRWVAVQMGDREAAIRAHEDLAATERDWLSDCIACVADGDVEYLIFLERHEDAVQAAGPILGGSLKCTDVPHRTHARLLAPLVRLGRMDEARHCHQAGYRLIDQAPAGFVGELGMHIAFLTATGGPRRAARVLQKHLPLAMAAVDCQRRFEFYLAAWRFAARWTKESARPLRLRLPANHRAQQMGDECLAKPLAAWLQAELEDLARQFDARNGNDWFGRRLHSSC